MWARYWVAVWVSHGIVLFLVCRVAKGLGIFLGFIQGLGKSSLLLFSFDFF